MKELLIGLLSLIMLLAVPQTALATEAPTGIPLSEIERRIGELVENYMDEFTPGLAIAVVHNGEIIFSQGYGYANVEQQISVDPATTVFELASVSKLPVYVSVMQLVEQGLIDLDNDIHNYLPQDFAQQLDFEYSFTVRDLLNHSAGFEQYLFNLYRDLEAVDTMTTLRNGLLASQPNQSFQPRTATAYSNFGSALLAYVVSYVSGLEYADFEQINILNPLGMENTRNQPHWFGDDAFIQSRARGYQPDGNDGFDEAPLLYQSMYPQGALNGTVEDLAQFAIALMPPQGEPSPLFESRNTLDLMLSPSYSDSNMFRGTHHGFQSYDGVVPALGHSGGGSGFNTQFVIVPSERFGVIVFSNADGGALFIEKILDLLIGNSRDMVSPSTENLPDASNVAGTYVMYRRHEGNILELLNATIFDTNIEIEAVDEHTITLTAGGETITYQQVEPYVFRAVLVETLGAQTFARTIYELRFTMDDEQPVGVSLNSSDGASIQTSAQAMTFAIANIIYWASLAFFLLMPIILLVGRLRRKEKTTSHFNRLRTGLLLCGTLLGINLIILDVRFLSVAPFLSSTVVTPHIWINYILLALSTVAFVATMIAFKKEAVKTKGKILYFVTATFLVLHLMVIWHWNYFVMM